MDSAYLDLKDLKCLSCTKASKCFAQMGGPNLTLANSDCEYFDLIRTPELAENIAVPKRFWIFFNVPGFYDIACYEVDRALYVKGELDKVWGTNGKNNVVAYKTDFGRTVFFSYAEAKNAEDAVIQLRKKFSDDAFIY